MKKTDENEDDNDVYVWEGRDYSPVFNGKYYLNSYPDLKAAFGENVAAAFTHFTSNGMTEGRQASEKFNVHVYKNRYEDLKNALRENLILYYQHYIDYGIKEVRSGV